MARQADNIRHYSIEEIADRLKELGQPAFRARQVWQWIWEKHARSFDDMTDLPKDLRQKLAEHFRIYHPDIAAKQVSTDGTIKCAFKLFDGELVEGVLIPKDKRMTACVSSQVGCSLACSFCATARLPRRRNLYYDEIYDQVAAVDALAREHYQAPLTNIVFMGMGEPLLNYSQVMAAIERICSPDGMGMSPRRITLSTAGIAKMIARMGDDGVKFNLALSLHAASDAKRDQIMPVNETNNLEALRHALRYFYDKTGNRITLEYVMLRGFNDSLEDADNLARFSRSVPSKVNLIEYNPIEGGQYEKSTGNALYRFKEALEARGVIANIRRSRGEDIDAACGQLANKGIEAGT